MKKKQFVFIDDAGDAGQKSGSSRYLVMAAVVFNDDFAAEDVSLAMRKYRRKIGWSDDHKFKFNKTKKTYVAEVLKIVSKFDFKIYSLVVNKSEITDVKIIQGLYNRAIADLLNNIPLEHASIKIDGHSGTNYTKRAATYFRKRVNINSRKIAEIKFADSKENILIQLADLVASSIYRSLRDEKTDSGEYVKIIRKKIVNDKRKQPLS